VQQTPPNMAINGLALILTLYIMAPVGAATWELYKQQTVPSPIDIETALDIASKLKEPLQTFLAKHANPTTVDFLVRTTKKLWPETLSANLTKDSLIVLIPAFAFSELTRAFQIGFLLYLPFIVVDLIISNILLAMGMMMVSPMTISLPFKLLLFVLLDGWTQLMQGLILSYM